MVHDGCVEVWDMEALGTKVDGRGLSPQGRSLRQVYSVLFSVLLSASSADYSHPLLLTDKKHTRDNAKFMLYSKYSPSHPIEENAHFASRCYSRLPRYTNDCESVSRSH